MGNDICYAQAIACVLRGRPGLRELAKAGVVGHLWYLCNRIVSATAAALTRQA